METRQEINQTGKLRTLQLKLAPAVKPYMVIAWNINGYSSDIHAWMLQFVQQSNPDVIFLSETKKQTDYLTPLFEEFTNYNVIVNVHNPARWHGVAMLIRKDHTYDRVPIQMNIPPRQDSKDADPATGRVIAIHLNKQVYIIGSYTPNSGRGGKYLHYRTAVWDPSFMGILDYLRGQGPTMWVGDINVAPELTDMSNPASMLSWPGCSKEERDNFAALINTGNWIDIWRQQNPTGRSYTWCGAPPRPNYGLRLDNILVSDSLISNTLNAFTISDCPISADHIPIGVYVKK